jgi:hypothetical protein
MNHPPTEIKFWSEKLFGVPVKGTLIRTDEKYAYVRTTYNGAISPAKVVKIFKTRILV